MFFTSFNPAPVAYDQFIDCIDLINKYCQSPETWGFRALGGECESDSLRSAFGIPFDETLPRGRYLYGFTSEEEIIKGLFFLAKGKGWFIAYDPIDSDDWFYLLRVQ